MTSASLPPKPPRPSRVDPAPRLRRIPRPAAPPSPAPAPRLIATDLDGTLLRSDKTISPRTAAALAAAERAGVEVFFVTGRPVRWMGIVSAQAVGHGIAICANGAAVQDLRRDKLVEVHPLAVADALTVVAALRAELPGISFAVERTDCFAHEAGYPLLTDDASVRRHVGPVEDLLRDSAGPVLKLLVRHPDYDPDGFLATARKAAGRLAEFTRSSAIALLEVSAPGVSKATTLARCCAARGVTRAEVVAFGDMPNDLAMLTWAGTSYAVANAHPEVLAATTHRTATNDEDGVAQVIEAILDRLR